MTTNMLIPVKSVDGTLLSNETPSDLAISFLPSRQHCLWEQARRAVVHMGWRCSYRCVFCYGQHSRQEKFCDYEDLLDELQRLKAYGILDVEFSGGEPTEYGQLAALIRAAKSMGFRRAAIISNGMRLSSKTYFKALLKAGLDEVLFSVHGYSEESHDTITGIKGSWVNLVKAIQNAIYYGCYLRVNTTVCRFNAEHLEEHAKVLTDICGNKLRAMNWLPLNYWDDAVDSQAVDIAPYKYEEHMIKAVHHMESHGVPWLAIRYAPFCAFPSLSKYIVGQYQHIYDPFDWNREAYTTQDYPLLDYPYGNFAYEACGKSRKHLYVKPAACLNCKYLYACDGVEKQLVHHGVCPIKGEYILDVMAERKQDNSAYEALVTPKTITVAQDFTKYPGGRTPDDGPSSGEELREKFLLPALRTHDKVNVDLNGTMGYAASFLDEAFGKLVYKGFSGQELRRRLHLVGPDWAIADIWDSVRARDNGVRPYYS